MPSLASRSFVLRSAAALLSVATLAGTTAVANASVTRPAAACRPHTQSVAGQSAAQVLRTAGAVTPKACGFSISGYLLGTAFDEDGVQLLGKTSYDSGGNVHMVFVFQGIVIDVYRTGGNEYVRMYEFGQPNAKPDLNLTTMWHAYGVSTSVINAAGSSKWVKLTAAQRKAFAGTARFPSTIGVLGSPASFAAALVKGTGKPWKLSGTATVSGVRCTVLTDPASNSNGSFPAETLYVNTATGQPVYVHYASQNGTRITTTFTAWGHTSHVSAPRQVVVG